MQFEWDPAYESGSRSSSENDMREEYDFTGGVRGKYLEQYRRGANVVVLDPDVAEVFHDSESVNQALRLLLKVAEDQGERVEVEGAGIIRAIRRELGGITLTRG